MVSTFTTAKSMEQVGRGDQVGVWDSPENSNWGVTDAALGQFVVIPLNNSNVVLSAAQFRCNTIAFNSTLTGSVTVTFPTSVTGPYNIANLCTGSSAFTITAGTTFAGGKAIGLKPGGLYSVFNDGQTIQYMNLENIGAYWDYAGSSLPNWVSACSIPPYLLCDGTSVNPAIYPQLFALIGATLPDLRGVARYTHNQGTGRLTAASGGLDGNTLFAIKPTQTVTIGVLNLPPYTPSGSVTGTASNSATLLFNGNLQQSLAQGGNGFGWSNQATLGALTYTLNAAFSGNAQGGLSNPLPAIGTGTIGGITMIRAA